MRNNVFLFICYLLLTISCKDKPQNNTSVANQGNNIDKGSEKSAQSAIKKKRIVFFGNSLTAGFGLDQEFSFPSLIQKRIDSLQLAYEVVNAGLSGETTSGGKNRIDWILKQEVDVFVLELGANDVLRGLSEKDAEKNLREILTRVKQKYPNVKIVIAGMQAPPNMGSDYTEDFQAIFPKLAKEFNGELIPFLLDKVALIPTLNLQDGKHPNKEGQKIVMENVWRELKKVL